MPFSLFRSTVSTGVVKQDDAAEDPLVASQSGLPLNYDLYWTNKLQVPLKEILSPVLNPEQMRGLMSGGHTQVGGGGWGGEG